MKAGSRIDELDMGLNSSSDLREYVKRVRDLSRDFYMELEFAAQVLQQNLSTVPAVDPRGGHLGRFASRRRARKVAACLKRAAEAQKYAGGQAAKTWAMFVAHFAPEIDAARTWKPAKPAFSVGE